MRYRWPGKLAGVLILTRVAGCCCHKPGFWITGEWDFRCGRGPLPVAATAAVADCESAESADCATGACATGPCASGACDGSGPAGSSRRMLLQETAAEGSTMQKPCVLRRRSGPSAGQGRGDAEPQILSGPYRHPTLHPVPTRPVFAPAEMEGPCLYSVPTAAPTAAPGVPPQIRVPTPPVPDEISRPAQPPTAKTDQVTQAPRRLSDESPEGSWLFRSVSPRPLEASKPGLQADREGGPMRR